MSSRFSEGERMAPPDSSTRSGDTSIERPSSLFERVEHRPGEGVAHDDHEVRLVALHQLPERERIEVMLGGNDDGSAGVQRAEGHPVRGPVHEGARGDAPRARARVHRSAIISGVVIGLPPPPAPPSAPKKTSSWRHMTPLGMPVVPPV